MSGGFSIAVDLSDLGMDTEVSAAEAAVRPAAQAGAEVLYQAVKKNIGKIGRVTGNLASSIYQAYSRDNSNKLRAQYHVSWNRRKAPHGHLVEFGHLQRYAVYVDKHGRWRTAIRPEKRGTPPPKRSAPLSAKDAYYVPLKGGPRIVPPKSFVRAAQTGSTLQLARAAMIDRWWAERARAKAS